jgi:hypothetical protein
MYDDPACEAVVITSFFYFQEVLQNLQANGFKGNIYRLNERNELVRCKI